MNSERITVIKERLNSAFTLLELDVVDDSAKHAGHAGAATGMGHFILTIKAEEFQGINTLARHRLIYAALGNLMETDIHALSIKASTPDN